jgi:hypothetical protein
MRRKSVLLVLAAVALIAVADAPEAFAEGAGISLSPPEWDLGTVTAGTRMHLVLHVVNNADRKVTVSVIPNCGCLSTGPSRQVIPAGSSADFRFSFLVEEGERGRIRESYLIQTDLKSLDHFFFPVHGVIKLPALR